MDPRITALKTTAFSCRRPAREQIADYRETAGMLHGDSRSELAKTICEHLDRAAAKGDYKVGACLKTREGHGIPALPPKREHSVRDIKSGPA